MAVQNAGGDGKGIGVMAPTAPIQEGPRQSTLPGKRLGCGL